MTREEFIKVLDDKGYSYKLEGDKVVVTHEGEVILASLKTLPLGVEFRNSGDIDLRSLKTLPLGVKFRNKGIVWMLRLKSIPPDVEFNGDAYLGSIIGNRFFHWGGNIKGIESNRLLNFMISKGMFI